MAISTIYQNGVNEVVVPATQSIAISNFGGGIASIYYLIGNANRPPAYQLQQTLNNSSVVLGAFADGMTIKIEAGASIVRYDVGASPDTGIGDADTLGGELPSYYTNATNVSSGTLDDARLSSNIPLKNAANTFTDILTINVGATNYPLAISGTSDIKMSLINANNPQIKFFEGVTAKAYISWISTGYMLVANQEDGSSLRIKDDLDFTADGVTYYSVYHEGLNPSLAAGNGVSGTFTTADAKTVTVTDGIITSIV